MPTAIPKAVKQLPKLVGEMSKVDGVYQAEVDEMLSPAGSGAVTMGGRGAGSPGYLGPQLGIPLPSGHQVISYADRLGGAPMRFLERAQTRLVAGHAAGGRG